MPREKNLIHKVEIDPEEGLSAIVKVRPAREILDSMAAYEQHLREGPDGRIQTTGFHQVVYFADGRPFSQHNKLTDEEVYFDPDGAVVRIMKKGQVVYQRP